MKKMVRLPVLAFLLTILVFTDTSPVWPQNQSRNFKVIVNTAEGKALNLYGASHALVVGVSNYTNGWPVLREAVNDAREVKAALELQNFSVTLVENPTAEKLKTEIENFVAVAGQGPENRLLFYFAGHGHTQRMAYGDTLGYIVPSDAPLPVKDPAGFQLKAISMESFSSYARGINAKHALFMFDSCFSGSIFSLTRAPPDAITHKTSLPVRQFITAGSAYETVPDKSIFKQQFLAALQGEGDIYRDGYVTGTELGVFLYTTVTNYSSNSQHPQYGTIRVRNLDKGDFVFVVPVTSPPDTSFDPRPYESEANLLAETKRLATTKAQWDKWHQKMSTDYERVQKLDDDTNLAATSKAQMWQDFLNSYSSDNPYSIDDETIRREARSRQNFWRAYQPPQPELTRAAPDDMVLIPAGSFEMGSNDGEDDEKPVHRVEVDEFYLDKYEVTVAKYQEFINANSFHAKPDNWDEQLQNPNRPVVYVSWNDAVAYCEWLSRLRKKRVRLPTEAEWEYASRGGLNGKKYSWGDDISAQKANYNADGKRDWGWENAKRYLRDIGNYVVNNYGLYDMAGNVYEWCANWYSENYHKLSSPTGTFRVLRGGSWDVDPQNVRCANRNSVEPRYRLSNAGFRCAQDVR